MGIELQNVAIPIVRQELFKKDSRNEALLLSFEITHTYVDPYTEYRVRNGLFVLYHRKIGNYVSVYSALTDCPWNNPMEISEWKFHTTHDSAWRDVGVYTNAIRQTTEELNSKLLKNNKIAVTPEKMNKIHRFSHNSHAYEWFRVVAGSDTIRLIGPGEEDPYTVSF